MEREWDQADLLAMLADPDLCEDTRANFLRTARDWGGGGGRRGGAGA
jgi:hypothetical protein